MQDVDLGKKYREDFRQYLLGETKFPKDAALIIDIFNFRSPALATMIFPYGGRSEHHHYFRFTIPGIAFNLFVGQMMPSHARSCCTVRSAEGIVFSSKKDDAIVKDFIKLMRTAKPSLKLERRS